MPNPSSSSSNVVINFFFYKCFDQMWLNEEARIAQVANINQLPGTNGFTSPLKYTHRRKKA